MQFFGLFSGRAALAGVAAALLPGLTLAAGSIAVQVVDRDGAPVPEVAASAVPLDAPAISADGIATATMNQNNLAFSPHVLVVATGTAVEFPNDDDVSHHVYSFSDAKRFNFTVVSQSVHSPLVFDQAGLVVLSCNIHDDMLGYILVVDTPHFTQTDGDGLAMLDDLPPGRYTVSIWTPRARARDLPEAVIVDVPTGETVTVEHRFEKLYAPHRHSDTSLKWGY